MSQKLVNNYGVKKGDSIAFSMRNYPEWIISYMAVTSIGAIAVPLNSWWKRDELKYGITHSESKIPIPLEPFIDLYNTYDMRKYIIQMKKV